MQFFKIEYIKNGEKKEIIVQAGNKIEAIKDFKLKAIGVFKNIKEVDEPIAYKLEILKNRIKEKIGRKK